MKKILTIFCLVLSIQLFAQGQTDRWDWFRRPNYAPLPAPPAYNDYATIYFTRAGITDVSVKSFYNDYIFQPLQDSGLIGDINGDSLYGFVWLSAPDSNTAKIPLLKFDSVQSWVNKITFSIDTGAISSGTGAYIETKFNPILDSSYFKRFCNMLFLYSRTNISEGSCDMGTATTTLTDLAFYSAGFYWGNNSQNTNTGWTTTTGLVGGSRRDATSQSGYQNGVLLHNDATKNAGDFPNLSFVVCGRKDNGVVSFFTLRQYACYGWGLGLSDIGMRKLYNIVETALDQLGVGVQ